MVKRIKWTRWIDFEKLLTLKGLILSSIDNSFIIVHLIGRKSSRSFLNSNKVCARLTSMYSFYVSTHLRTHFYEDRSRVDGGVDDVNARKRFSGLDELICHLIEMGQNWSWNNWRNLKLSRKKAIDRKRKRKNNNTMIHTILQMEFS